jgi:hypothetical protein
LTDRAAWAVSAASASVALGDLQVQLDQLFHAFEGLVGQTEQGFEVGLVGGGELFRGETGHGVSPMVE